MEKLKLEYLVPYLNHKLLVTTTHKRDEGKTFELLSLHTNKNINNSSASLNINPNFKTRIGMSVIKPILRPLSDLRKEFYFEGADDIPVDYLADKYPMHNIESTFDQILDDNEDWIYHLDYYLILHLFEWHFDVFGLIEKGLAIDINTI